MGGLIEEFKLDVSYRHLMTAGGKWFNRQRVPSGETTGTGNSCKS